MANSFKWLVFGCSFLVIQSIFLIFSNLFLAIISFLLAIILYRLAMQTPEAQALRLSYDSKQKQAELIDESLAAEIFHNYQQLLQDSTNAQALNKILTSLPKLSNKKLEILLDTVLLPLLKLQPCNEGVRKTTIACAKRLITRSLPMSQRLKSRLFYDEALEILEQNPEQNALKQYVLEVGLWYYSIIRDSAKISTKDEQSIQDDILLRTKSTP